MATTLGAVRERELRAACERLGVSEVACSITATAHVGEIDPVVPDRGRRADPRSSAEPDAVVTFGEDGAYGHPDHIAIGEATRRRSHLRHRRELRSPTHQFLRSHFPATGVSIAGAWRIG